MTLYKKHRPQKFKEIVGNAGVVESLQKMVSDLETCPHSFLFHGPTGCGKTTLARIVGKELGIKGSDLRELDVADFRGIDVIREIRKQSAFKAIEGKNRMWILDESHKLTNDAQNALLKILEDTPDHVYFILCTTDPQKLIKTIRGRCSQFSVDLLTNKEMQKLLLRVCRAEKVKPQKKWIIQIIKEAKGHPRNALQILDQVIRVSEKNRLKIIKQIALEENQSIELCRALLKNDPWKKIRNILKGLKDQDPESIRRHVLGYAQSVVLNADNERAGLIMEEFLTPTYDAGFAQIVYASYVVSKN